MSIHDRDYMREDEPAGRDTRKPGNVDKMLQQLDLSNLPPSPPKPALRRALDWLRRLLGLPA